MCSFFIRNVGREEGRKERGREENRMKEDKKGRVRRKSKKV
jgi:hypothetical protein